MRNFTIIFFILLSAFGASAQTSKLTQIRELLTDAESLIEQQNYDEALDKCRDAIALDPKYATPYVTIGRILSHQLKFAEASEWFSKAISLQPDDKVIYLLKARSDFNGRAFEDAATASRKAIRLDPEFAQAHLALAETLRWAEKDLDEAASSYRTALRLAPQFHQFVGLAADFFAYKKSYKNAEELYRAAIAADPEKMSGRFSFGRMLIELGRLKEARELWEGRTRGEGQTFPKFETVLLRAERVQNARDAVAKNPNDADALLELGEAVMDGDSWVVDGRQEKAIDHFRAALKARPGFVAAQKGIVRAFIQLADTFNTYKPNVDAELAELKRLDPVQAEELEKYLATYKGGIIVVAPKKKP